MRALRALEEMIAAINAGEIDRFTQTLGEIKLDDDSFIDKDFQDPEQVHEGYPLFRDEMPVGRIRSNDVGFLFEKMLIKASQKKDFIEALYKKGLNPRIGLTMGEREKMEIIIGEDMDAFYNLGIYIALETNSPAIVALTANAYLPQEHILRFGVLHGKSDEVAKHCIEVLKTEKEGLNKLYSIIHSSKKKTILDSVVSISSWQRCRLLLSVGADPNIPGYSGDSDSAYLTDLLSNRWLDSVTLGKNATPLHRAMAAGEYEKVRALLEFGADLTKTDQTPSPQKLKTAIAPQEFPGVSIVPSNLESDLDLVLDVDHDFIVPAGIDAPRVIDEANIHRSFNKPSNAIKLTLTPGQILAIQKLSQPDLLGKFKTKKFSISPIGYVVGRLNEYVKLNTEAKDEMKQQDLSTVSPSSLNYTPTPLQSVVTGEAKDEMEQDFGSVSSSSRMHISGPTQSVVAEKAKYELKEESGVVSSTPLDYLPAQQPVFTEEEKSLVRVLRDTKLLDQLKYDQPLMMNIRGLPDSLDRYFASCDHVDKMRNFVIQEARYAIFLDLVEIRKSNADKSLSNLEIRNVLRKYCKENNPIFELLFNEFKGKKLSREMLLLKQGLKDKFKIIPAELFVMIMSYLIPTSVNWDVHNKVSDQFFNPLAQFSFGFFANIVLQNSGGGQLQDINYGESACHTKSSRVRHVSELFQSNSSSSSSHSTLLRDSSIIKCEP